MRKTGEIRYGASPWQALLLVPLAVCVIGSILLLLVTPIPKAAMRENTLASAEQLEEAGMYPLIQLPSAPMTYVEDTYTERVMIEEAYTMDRPVRVFLKPQVPAGEGKVMQSLFDAVDGVEPVGGYSRYWMGFRIWLRPMLCLADLNQMHMLFAAICFLLFIGNVITLSGRNSGATALGFAAACFLVEPYSISHSLQYMSCFLMMLVFCLLLNRRDWTLWDRETWICFCLFGAVTQFFDFYNNPLVTCVFPLLMLIDRDGGERRGRLLRILQLALAWLISYVITWLVGLLCVTLFTPQNGFALAFESVLERFGVGDFRDPQYSYSPREALWAVYWRATTRIFGVYLPAPAFAALILLMAGLIAAARIRSLSWGKTAEYLAIGALPLVWAAATAQPTIIHVCFQYRVISGTYFAYFLMLAGCIRALKSKGRRA